MTLRHATSTLLLTLLLVIAGCEDQAEPIYIAAPASEPPSTRSIAADGVLKFLASLTNRLENRVLAGQNLGHANYDLGQPLRAARQQVAGAAREDFAILGIDYGFDEIPADLSAANGHLIAQWRRGGLVTISMHPSNPWSGGGAHDTRVGPISDLFTDEHAASRHWHAQLDRVAAGLQTLKAAGVVVLWRPLHEMNGDWFWWSRSEGGKPLPPRDFVRLWRRTHRYLRVEKGLDNLLWVYAPNAQSGDATRGVKVCYPGDDFVDVVGIDYYADSMGELAHSYAELQTLNKPLGLTEFGPLKVRNGTFDSTLLIQGIRERYPKICFFLWWHSWPGAKVAMLDQRNHVNLMQDPWTVTLDEMPVLRETETQRRE